MEQSKPHAPPTCPSDHQHPIFRSSDRNGPLQKSAVLNKYLKEQDSARITAAYALFTAHFHHRLGWAVNRMRKCVLAAIPEVSVNGDASADSLYTVPNFHFPRQWQGRGAHRQHGHRGRRMQRGGSACSSGSNKGSPVIEALYPGRTGANIRFSFRKFNTEAEVDRAVEVLQRVMAPMAVQA